MSVPSGHIRCHGCEYQGVLQYRPLTLRYRLPDGETVDRGRTFGWCDNCDEIRDIECELEASAVRRRLDAANQKQQSIGVLFMSAINRALSARPSAAQSEVQELARLLRLAEQRRSSPRCLSCGEESVTHLSFDDQGTSSNFHHTCGGRLYSVPADPDAPRFNYRPEVLFLDVEGRRLKQMDI